MSLNFYDDNEDTAKEESINNYIDLFYNYEINPPNLKKLLIKCSHLQVHQKR